MNTLAKPRNKPYVIIGLVVLIMLTYTVLFFTLDVQVKYFINTLEQMIRS